MTEANKVCTFGLSAPVGGSLLFTLQGLPALGVALGWQGNLVANRKARVSAFRTSGRLCHKLAATKGLAAVKADEVVVRRHARWNYLARLGLRCEQAASSNSATSDDAV